MLETFEVDADFPGGNITVDEIDGYVVTVHQELRDTIGDWFYWAFRVWGAAGRSLTFRFSGSPAIGLRGPAVSTDAGETWGWLGAGSVRGNGFHIAVPEGAGEIRLCFGIPYGKREIARFLDRHAEHPALARELLCRSEAGREVDLLRVAPVGRAPVHRVLLTARHHACEMMASHVLEGLLEWVLRANDAEARWAAEHVEFVAVPFMDVDGVEEGDQGKNRAPHDHNRDYGPDDGIYASVRALKALVTEAGEPFDVALDLHCPGISGPYNESIYLVGHPDESNWAKAGRLAELLERDHRGPLPYRAGSNLAYGQAWNTDANNTSRDGRAVLQSSSGLFMESSPRIRMNATLEFPYATVDGQEVNGASARLFGADLGSALRNYLSTAGADPDRVGEPTAG